MDHRYCTQNVGDPQYHPQQHPNLSQPQYQYRDYSTSTIPRQNFSVLPPYSQHLQSAPQSAHSINYYRPPGRQDWGPTSFMQRPSVPFYPICEQTPQHLKPKDLNELESDRRWVDNYISRIGKATPQALPSVCRDQKLQPKVHICNAKESVNVCVNILQELQNLENKLSEGMNTYNSEEWDNLFSVVELKNQDLAATLNKLKDPLALQELNLALKKRHNKRLARKRKHDAIKQLKIEARAKREKLHLSMDAWLERMQLSVEKVKSEESLKMQADLVLSDVTRKQVDARRQLTLLATMLKLRQLRVQVATTRGERVSVEQANIFENVVKNLQTYWADQLKGYNLEEKGLKVMLEEETHEQVKRNGTSVCRTSFSEWEKLLFGAKTSGENGYTLAERDVDFFMAVRYDWDKFHTLVAAPMATAMPIGWAMPVKPSSKQWEALLVGNCKIEK